MITKNPLQLKALIKKQATEKNISSQIVMQNYMMERLLERISLSSYKNNFILKGGFLIAAIVGLDTRATMDMDATIKGVDLTHESIRRIFDDICKIEITDDVKFSVLRTTDIHKGDDYPGIRISLSADYLPLRVYLSVDVTTGDKITPREVEYSFQLMFDERSINVLAYNLETIMAEKLETILSRNEANTRPRDFYDIYILQKLRGYECNPIILKEALIKTTAKRGSQDILTRYKTIMNEIKNSSRLMEFWRRYQREFAYADDILYKDICQAIDEILNKILK